MNTFQEHVHARYNRFASFCFAFQSVGILYARVRVLSLPRNTREVVVYLAAFGRQTSRVFYFGHFNAAI